MHNATLQQPTFSILDRSHVTSCTSDATPAGSDTQPVGEMAHFLLVRNGKTGRQEPPTDRSLQLLQVLMWKRCNNFLCHTAADWRNHFYTQWGFFFSGDAQIFTVCLILWFVDEAWISSMSMGSFKNGAKNNSNI